MHDVYLFQQGSPKELIGTALPAMQSIFELPPVFTPPASPQSQPSFVLSSPALPSATEEKKQASRSKRKRPVLVTQQRKLQRSQEVLDLAKPMRSNPIDLLMLCDAAEYYCLSGEPDDVSMSILL